MVFEPTPYATIWKITWKLSTAPTHKSTQIDICLRSEIFESIGLESVSISNIRGATKDDDRKENTEETDKTIKEKKIENFHSECEKATFQDKQEKWKALVYGETETS